MNLDLLIENLSNPALLFFVLGIVAVGLKSDLAIPDSSSKFISLYLLFSIGFKGGQELSHEQLNSEVFYSVLFGLATALLIPIYTFFILKRKLNIYDAGATAAAYGSISAVTFVTAVVYLETLGLDIHGHMVAIMAMLEAPAIIAGLILISRYNPDRALSISKRESLRHALTNGSVLLILGSLLIGFSASESQAQGIKPFTDDIFKGFLAIFLLDMGLESGKKLRSFVRLGWFPLAFAIVIPLINGCLVAWLSQMVTADVSNRFIFAVLAASASYIAVPAAMKTAVPQANAGLYLPMALAVTFPVNITIGLPLYFSIAENF